MSNIRKNTLEEGKIIPLWFDYIFCGIFNDEKNISLIENLVSVFLDIPIDDIKGNIKIKQRELPINTKNESNKQIDLLLDYKGEKLNIEVNSSSSKGLIDRNVVFISKIHGEQVEYGIKDYKEIRKSKQLNFNLNKKNEDKIVEKYYLTNNKGNILTKKLELDMIDLRNGSKEYEKDKRNRQARWCRILTTRDKCEFERLIKDDEFMDKKSQEKIKEEVSKYNNDEHIIQIYTKLSKEELIRNTEIAEAREEGIEQKTRESAINLYKNGVSKELIIKSLNITEEQFKEYISKVKK